MRNIISKMFGDIISLVAFILLLLSCSVSNKYSDKKYYALFSKDSNFDVVSVSPSPFIGSWSWVLDNDRNTFSISVAECDDILLFSFSAVSQGGKIVDGPEYDEVGLIPDVCLAMPHKGNIAKGKIHTSSLNYYDWYGSEELHGYKDISFELLDAETMVFRVEGNKRHIPDSAVLRKSKNISPVFSTNIPKRLTLFLNEE